MIKTESKQIILSILGISVLIIAFVGISYAAFNFSFSDQENTISTGTISLSFLNNTDSVAINNAIPISDEEGKQLSGKGNVYDFSVQTILSKNTTINYEISVERTSITSNSLADENIRFYLQKKDGKNYIDTPITTTPQPFLPLKEDSFLGSKKGNMVIYSGTFSNTTDIEQQFSQSFRLRMWVAQDTVIDSVSREFKVRLNVTAKAVWEM